MHTRELEIIFIQIFSMLIRDYSTLAISGTPDKWDLC